MAFGTRDSMQNDRTPTVAQETCVRCCGTGHVRERGQRLICKVCKGTGRTTVVPDCKTA
jgi:hypothetical protein